MRNLEIGLRWEIRRCLRFRSMMLWKSGRRICRKRSRKSLGSYWKGMRMMRVICNFGIFERFVVWFGKKLIFEILEFKFGFFGVGGGIDLGL